MLAPFACGTTLERTMGEQANACLEILHQAKVTVKILISPEQPHPVWRILRVNPRNYAGFFVAKNDLSA